MAVVWLDTDEWYPVYSVSNLSHPLYAEIDVAEDRLAWWQRAQDDFLAAQDDMQAAEKHAHERSRDADAEGNRIVPRWPA